MNLYNLKLVCHLLASSIIPVVFTRERLSVEAISQSFNRWNQTIACPTYSCAFIHSKPRLNKRHAGLWSILLNLLNYPLATWQSKIKRFQLENGKNNSGNFCIFLLVIFQPKWLSLFRWGRFAGEEELPGFSPEECPEADGHPSEEVVLYGFILLNMIY